MVNTPMMLRIDQSKPDTDLISKAKRVTNAMLMINRYSKNTGPNLLDKILLMNLEMTLCFKFNNQN